MPIAQSSLRNRLLRTMPPDAFAVLRPALIPIELPVRQLIVEAGERCDQVVFPESGIASQVAADDLLSIAMFGREGMGCTSVVLGVHEAPYRTTMLINGTGHSIRGDALARALEHSNELLTFLLRYVQAHFVQVAQNLLATGGCTIRERLARLILMTHDRLDGDTIHLTHEVIADTLGVRRTGITLALHYLEGDGMIRSNRGRLVVQDREKLSLAAASSGYGEAERGYERLLGANFRHPTAALAEG